MVKNLQQPQRPKNWWCSNQGTAKHKPEKDKEKWSKLQQQHMQQNCKTFKQEFQKKIERNWREGLYNCHQGKATSRERSQNYHHGKTASRERSYNWQHWKEISRENIATPVPKPSQNTCQSSTAARWVISTQIFMSLFDKGIYWL